MKFSNPNNYKLEKSVSNQKCFKPRLHDVTSLGIYNIDDIVYKEIVRPHLDIAFRHGGLTCERTLIGWKGFRGEPQR